jgi:hypothetical protein
MAETREPAADAAQSDAYQDYILRKRKREAEEPTSTDTTALPPTLTGAEKWWGFDAGGIMPFLLAWSFVGIPLIPAWYVWWHWKFHKLNYVEKAWVETKHGWPAGQGPIKVKVVQ